MYGMAVFSSIAASSAQSTGAKCLSSTATHAGRSGNRQAKKQLNGRRNSPASAASASANVSGKSKQANRLLRLKRTDAETFRGGIQGIQNLDNEKFHLRERIASGASTTSSSTTPKQSTRHSNQTKPGDILRNYKCKSSLGIDSQASESPSSFKAPIVSIDEQADLYNDNVMNVAKNLSRHSFGQTKDDSVAASQNCMMTALLDHYFVYPRVCHKWGCKAPTTLLSLCGDIAGHVHAHKLLQWLVDNEHRTGLNVRNAYCFTAVIKAAVKSKDLAHAEYVFGDMIDNRIEPTIITFNELLTGYAAKGLEPESIRLVKSMTSAKYKIKPDTVTYNLLIRAAGPNHNGFSRAMLLYEELKRSGNIITGRTVSAVISAGRNQIKNGHKSALHEKELDFLLEMFRDCKHLDIKLNNHHISSLAPLAPQLASKLLIKRIKDPNVVAFSSVIQAMTKYRPKEAINIFNLMKERGVEPNLYCLSSVIVACKMTGDIDLAFESFDKMRVDRFAAKQSQALGSDRLRMEWKSNSETNEEENFGYGDLLVVYNSLLGLCASRSSTTAYYDKGINIFSLIKRSKEIRPDLISYNSLLTACAHRQAFEDSVQYYKEMRAENIIPDLKTFNIMLSICSSSKKLVEGYEILKDMKELQIQGHLAHVAVSTSLSLLICSCVDAAIANVGESIYSNSIYFNLAFKYFDEMRSMKVSPTVHTYAALIKLSAYRGDVGTAVELFKKMYDEDIAPNDECHNLLIQCCSKARDLDSMMKVVVEISRKHGRLDDTSIKSIFEALCLPGQRSFGLPNVADETRNKEILHDDNLTSRTDITLRSAKENGLSEIAEGNSLAGKSLDRALRVLSLLASSRIDYKKSIKSGTISLIITSLSLQGRASDALDVYKRLVVTESMNGNHKRITDESFSCLISVLCRNRFLQDALYVFDFVDLARPSLSPTESAFRAKFQTIDDNDETSIDLNNVNLMTNVSDSSPIEEDVEPMLCTNDSVTWYPRANAYALCDLVYTFARNGDLQRSLTFYIILNSLPEAKSAMTKCSYIFEALIEECCRSNYDIEQALDVFDDMKDVGASISLATLAFLLRCCKLKSELDSKSREAFEWRIYDVAATIRYTREQEKKQKLLALSPSSKDSCHHVTNSGDKMNKLHAWMIADQRNGQQ